MANVSLQPGTDGVTTEDLIGRVEQGLYVVGDKSWSIDMQRFNFQFTGQRFYRIEEGRLAGQVRDAAYQATTTNFWGSMEAVGGPDTWVLGGAFNCGRPSRRASGCLTRASGYGSSTPGRGAADAHRAGLVGHASSLRSPTTASSSPSTAPTPTQHNALTTNGKIADRHRRLVFARSGGVASGQCPERGVTEQVTP
jgi:hypothetical protein